MQLHIQNAQTSLGSDQYIMFDAGQIASIVEEHGDAIRQSQSHAWGKWSGDTFETFKHKAAHGDESLVEESDRFLEKIEDQVPMSRGWRNVDDVVGAVPVIPSYLAGHPQCMRRRERVQKDNAPLAIYMDLTSSGGINASKVRQRGIVLLALVRLLVEHRPVELWVGSSLGGYGYATTTAWRIDTAPLDLARAAYHIGATAMSRGFGYGMCQRKIRAGGAWPFSDYDRHCATAKDRLSQILTGQEIMYIPPIFLTDPMTTNPVAWLRRVLNITTED